MKLASVLLSAVGLAAVAPTSMAGLVISEVLYNEAGSDAGGEFIEIYNNGSTTIDLTNYKIGDEETSGGSGTGEGMFFFPTGASIDPGEIQIIAVTGATFFGTYGFSANYEVLPDVINDDPSAPNLTVYSAWDPDGTKINMANSSDHAIILDASDNVVDAVSWGTATFAFDPPLVSDEGDGQSYARLNVFVDTDTAADWALVTAKPDGASWANFATPGTVNVPEPASLALAGMGGLLVLTRRRASRA